MTDWLTGGVLIAYVLGMFGLAVYAHKKVHSVEDFLVAGRRLPFSFSFATLLATWFGAGTMLTAADSVRSGGMVKAALEPFGAGLCLVIAGIFFARPLWNMGLLTLADFFGRKFGRTTELAAAIAMVPAYFGWIAVQFIALASLLEMIFGLPLVWGILLVAVVGTGYTLLGGMWSVTLTDAVQVSLLLVGLLILGYETLAVLGGGDAIAGFARLGREVPAPMLEIIPSQASAFVSWLGVLAVASLGNLPSQDLTQRMFSAKSADVAARACWTAGLAYIAFGLIPVLVGLSARLLLPESVTQAVVPAVARAALHPWVSLVFTIALASAVLSTIDSAILSPASVIAQNILRPLTQHDPLSLNRWSVVGVAAVSLVTAYVGDSAYGLLEDAYSIGLVSLFVPLVMGMTHEPISGRPAMVSMLGGGLLWLLHYGLGWERFLEPLTWSWSIAPPVALTATFFGFVAYGLTHALDARAVARAAEVA